MTAWQTASWLARKDGKPKADCRSSESGASGETGTRAASGLGRRKRLPHLYGRRTGQWWRRRFRRRTARRCDDLPHLADHLAHVVLDAFDEGRELRGAALDAVQVGLPLARHDGTLDFGVDHLDQADSFVGGLEALAVADDVLALEQHFDDGSAGGGRAQARLLHRVGEFLLIEGLARGFHGGEQGSFGQALGGARLLLQGLRLQNVLRLAFGETRRQFLFGRRVGGGGRGLLRLRGRQIEHLPADLLHGAARGVIAVHDGVVADRRDHGGDGPDVVVMPGAEQAAADQIVDLALFGGERAPGRRRWWWE